MLRARGWMGLIALGLCLVSSFATAQTSSHRHKTPQKQLQLPPLPSGPLSQVPMDQLPAAPPSVSYQGGLLTIVAQNSTLADILANVRKLTGASIDVPPNATERVVTRLGPGPAREVLASLLNGTNFNYVMIGSSNDPSVLSALVLTTRSGGTDGASNAFVAMANNQYTPPVLAAQPATQAIVPQPGNAAVADADDSDDDADAENGDNADNAGDATNASQLGGQQGDMTPEQLQQARQNLKPPQGFVPPSVGQPPAPNPH